MKKISIVFPLYNEQKRLDKLFNNIDKFNKAKKSKFCEFIFVDDGSMDTTANKISNFIHRNKKSNYKVIRSSKNYGKGHALKLGIKSSKYDWIFTMDADLSVNLFQINNWIKKYNFKSNYAYFGSRNHPKSNIKFKYYRKIIGNILQILVYLFVDKNIKDTQCGFKLYNKKYVKNIFNLLNEKGFAHDIELIFLLKRKGIKIKELPVTWKHVGNSKLNPFFESIRFFIRFIIIFLKYNLRK